MMPGRCQINVPRHAPDHGRICAAAAADDVRARRGDVLHFQGEIFIVAPEYHTPCRALREACIRHDRHKFRNIHVNPVHDLLHVPRTDAAVKADRIDVRTFREASDQLRGTEARICVAVHVDADLHKDKRVLLAICLPAVPDRGQNLIRLGKCLKDQDADACGKERVDNEAVLVRHHFPALGAGHRNRADVARDEALLRRTGQHILSPLRGRCRLRRCHRPGQHVLSPLGGCCLICIRVCRLLRRTPCIFTGSEDILPKLISPALKALRICGKCIRSDEAAARLDVRPVDSGDLLRVLCVEELRQSVRAVPGRKICAERAVRQYLFRLQMLPQALRIVPDFCHFSVPFSHFLI